MDDTIRPNGGFPPVAEISEAEIKIVEQSKNREFAKLSVGVSIKDIMMKRIKTLEK